MPCHCMACCWQHIHLGCSFEVRAADDQPCCGLLSMWDALCWRFTAASACSRMGGGPVRDTNLRVWGVDLVEEHLLTSLRIPSKPLILRNPRDHLAEYTLNAKRSGRVQHVDFMQVCMAPPVPSKPIIMGLIAPMQVSR